MRKTIPAAMDVFADIILSFDREEISVQAEGGRITVVFSSLRQGIQSVRRLLNVKASIERLQNIHSMLNRMGLSLYFKAGRVHAPVLGVNAPQRVVPALMNILQKFSAAKVVP